jgi:mono/diheme cytochrome c family protein
VLLGLVLLSGCFSDKARSIEEEAVRDEMAQHWITGEEARDAIIAGDLAKATKHGRALADQLPVKGAPEGHDAIQLAVKTHAEALADADDLERAALALGAMASQCGACHAATGGGPIYPEPKPPEPGEGIAAEMAVHQYAATLMWTGLVTNSTANFDTAVAALSANPLVPSGTNADSPLPPLATELEVRVHDLAAFAASSTDQVDRADLYGRMLGTCAACHAVVRGK